MFVFHSTKGERSTNTTRASSTRKICKRSHERKCEDESNNFHCTPNASSHVREKAKITRGN